MRRAVIAATLVVVVAAGIAIVFWKRGKSPEQYRFAAVERGSVEQVVTATGTLDAVTTVKVGTQVSGIIAELESDFNDRVTKGQVIARLDDTLLKIAVREATARLAQARSSLAQAQLEFDRSRSLRGEGVVAQGDLDSASTALDGAKANVQLAEEELAKAKRNLAYATIYAPIDGTVVDRFVEVGQTVAASLSAPDLFEIADLERMQILATVDESDVSQVRDGQSVRFTVQAYGDTRFTGHVRQLRLQSTTQENVVSYTAVIDVDPASQPLLPGMTATCEFQVAHADDVLLVPNAALRFRPTEAMIAALRERFRDARENGGEAASTGGRSRGGSGAPGSGFTGANGGRAMPPALWTLDENNQPRRLRIEVGLSDGQRTQVSGEGLAEGLKVITGVLSDGGTAGSNPFQPGSGSAPRRPPGSF